MKRKTRVKAHTRIYNGQEIQVKAHMRLGRQTAIQRSERTSRARIEGRNAELLAKAMFEKEGYVVADVSSSMHGAGDLLVTDDGKTFLVEVKKINEWEYISMTARRRGRIQINQTEHYDLLRNAKNLNATPLYMVFVKYDNGLFLPKYVSTKKITKHVRGKKCDDVKIPFWLVETEAFKIGKLKK